MKSVTFDNFIKYLATAIQIEKELEVELKNIEKLIKSGSRIIIWPYAQMGQELFSCFSSILPNEFIRIAKDRNADALLPEEVEFRKSDVVVIATRRYGDEISKHLKRLGCENWLMSFEMGLIFSDYQKELFGGQLFELEKYRDNLFNNKENYLQMYFSLLDSESKELFIRNMMYRMTKNARYSFKRSLGIEYFDEGIIDFKHAFSGAFIDAGGFNGDTLDSFLALNLHFNSYHLFEPDPEQFELALERTDNPRVSFNNCGVYSETKTLYLNRNSNDKEYITLTEQGDIQVNVLKLDDYCKDLNVSFIKMDIEGGEVEALKGASEIIRKQAPTLAICIYHKPNDYIEIFNLIRNLNSSYQFHIRKYSTCNVDTVLYAI